MEKRAYPSLRKVALIGWGTKRPPMSSFSAEVRMVGREGFRV